MIFTPTPTVSVTAAERNRGLVAAVIASASASSIIVSVSMCALPTASTSSVGFSPTKAAAPRMEWFKALAARAISATAVRLESAATAFSAQSPPASPSGAVR